jgi:hypothetical protein
VYYGQSYIAFIRYDIEDIDTIDEVSGVSDNNNVPPRYAMLSFVSTIFIVSIKFNSVQRYSLPGRFIIPLPKMLSESSKHAEFAPNDIVLALYPGTTCFYKAKVIVPPSKVRDDKHVLPNTYIPNIILIYY